MNADTLGLPWIVTTDPIERPKIYDVDGRLVAEFVDPRIAEFIVKVLDQMRRTSPFL
jgi:hypothetical protein